MAEDAPPEEDAAQQRAPQTPADFKCFICFDEDKEGAGWCRFCKTTMHTTCVEGLDVCPFCRRMGDFAQAFAPSNAAVRAASKRRRGVIRSHLGAFPPGEVDDVDSTAGSAGYEFSPAAALSPLNGALRRRALRNTPDPAALLRYVHQHRPTSKRFSTVMQVTQDGHALTTAALSRCTWDTPSGFRDGRAALGALIRRPVPGATTARIAATLLPPRASASERYTLTSALRHQSIAAHTELQGVQRTRIREQLEGVLLAARAAQSEAVAVSIARDSAKHAATPELRHYIEKALEASGHAEGAQ